MGLYDEVLIDDHLINQWNKFLFKDDPLPIGSVWQTKDLGCNMEHYFLKLGYNDLPRLYLLELPNKEDEKYKHFFIPYSAEEIEKINKDAIFECLKVKPGDGLWHASAWFPENRKQRDMGQLPHAIISIYEIKDDVWYDLELKFTDGVLVALKRYWKTKDLKLERESNWLEP